MSASSKHSFRLLDASLKKCWTSSKGIHPSLRTYNVNSWRLHSATVSYCTTRHDLGTVQHTSFHDPWRILDYCVQEGMYLCPRGLWKQRESAIVIIISFHTWRVLRKRYSTGGMAVFIPRPKGKWPFPFLRCQRNKTSLALSFKYCYSEGAFIVWPRKKPSKD